MYLCVSQEEELFVRHAKKRENLFVAMFFKKISESLIQPIQK
jgi:hypothetical protein